MLDTQDGSWECQTTKMYCLASVERRMGNWLTGVPTDELSVALSKVDQGVKAAKGEASTLQLFRRNSIGIRTEVGS